MRSLAPLLVIIVCSAELAFGSAFAINELGARAQGMGGAFTAVADDPTAIFFNPAGIAYLKGMQMSMDMLIIAGQFRFIPSDPLPGAAIPAKGFSGNIKTPFIPVANLYITKNVNERMTVGFGVYVPHGLAANFTNFNDSDPANTKYPGRFAGTRAKLEQYWFQPTVGFKVTPNQSVGLGVAWVHTHLLLEQSLLNPQAEPSAFTRDIAKDVFPSLTEDQAVHAFQRLLPEGRLRAAATANRLGFTGGYLYKNTAKKFNFGISARSAIVSHLKGKASFAFGNEGAIRPFLPKDRTLEILFPNQDITAVFTTPANYQAGVATTKFFGSTISFEIQMQQFDRFKDLPINFAKNKDSKGRDLATSAEQRIVFDFRNSYQFKMGIEKPVPAGAGFGPMKKLLAQSTVRTGVLYDRTPVVDKSVGPLFPDSSRVSWTGGLTKRRKTTDFTFFYQFMQMLNRTVDVHANKIQGTNGNYNNFVNAGGLSMRFRNKKAAEE